MGVQRDAQHIGAVQGARPYAAVPGAVPAGGNRHQGVEGARPYVSDTPFHQPYADRPTCRGKRTDGQPCGAKAAEGKECCGSHQDQE